MLLRKRIITRRLCQTSRSGSGFLLQQLKDRSLIRVSGNDVVSYLQGLVTNDLQHLNNASSLYAMFLNQRGRVLYDTIIFKTPETNTWLLEADRGIISDLKKHLMIYKVRRKISIDIVDDEYSIWFSNRKENFNSFLNVQDPRIPALGYRIIARNGIEVTSNFENRNEESCYKKLRYELGIGEGIIELPPGNCFPLEANCDYLHGVSFHKGCYIGQELTARTHHTGMVRKRIMPVLFENNIQIPQESLVNSKSLDKSCGKIRGTMGRLALGLLRVDEALRAEDLHVDGNPCKTKRPDWWPIEAPKKRSPIA